MMKNNKVKKKIRGSMERNDKKILEHQFGREYGSGVQFHHDTSK